MVFRGQDANERQGRTSELYVLGVKNDDGFVVRQPFGIREHNPFPLIANRK